MRNAFRSASRAVKIPVTAGLIIGLSLVVPTPLHATLAAGTSEAAGTGPHSASRPAQGPGLIGPTRPHWLVKSNDLALLRQ